MNSLVSGVSDATETASALVARLTTLVERDGAGGTVLAARAGNAYRLRSLRTSGAFISLVLMGSKRIHHGGGVDEVVVGQGAVVAAGQCIDVENLPSAATGQYLAALILLPESVLQIARTLLGEPIVSTAAMPCATFPLQAIAADLARCVGDDTPLTRSRREHALAGLLLTLHEAGIDTALQALRPRLCDSIGSLLASEPAREWRSADIEERFAVSGATLRRQLAAEKTSLRLLLAETRLSQALHLLQSTRLP